jgi:hypothetical protein
VVRNRNVGSYGVPVGFIDFIVQNVVNPELRENLSQIGGSQPFAALSE